MKTTYNKSKINSLLFLPLFTLVATACSDSANSPASPQAPAETPAQTARAVAQPGSLETALKMVESTGLGNNLISMCGKKISHSEKYKDIEKSTSRQTAFARLDKALADVLPRHQELWNRNLAESYIGLLSQEEMESITSLKEKSPYINRMLIRSKKASTNMQEKSTALFKQACDEVMETAFADLPE